MEVWKEYNESPWGRIPKEWDLSCVKDETDVVTDYVANGSFASLAENVKYKSEEDYAVLIRLVDYNNQYKGDFVFIDKDAYEFLGKSKLYGDEIIISNVGANVGTVFKCPHLKYKMSLAPNSIMVKFKGDNDFYYYWLKSRFGQHMLQSIVTGSAQPKFNKTNFRDMAIPVPPIEEQRQIGMVLKSLDDKIEVNRRINENLEQQAQALFKSWFVDFEPFKDQPFVESELGMIPQGWKVEKIEDLAEKMGSGGTPKSLNKEYYSGEIRWFSTKELKDCFLFDSEKHISLDALNNSAAKLFPEGTILMAIYAAPTVGRLGILTKTSSFNQAAVGIVPKVTIGMEFLFLSLLSERTNLNNLASGAAQQNLNVGIVKNYRIVIPPLDVLNKFNPIANGFFEKIRTIQQESRRLAELRDTLLPRLMSGELKINDLENNEI